MKSYISQSSPITMTKILIAACILFLFVPWQCWFLSHKNETISNKCNVEKVFMHTMNSYSFYLKNGNTLTPFLPNAHKYNWTVKTDAQPNQSSYIEYTITGNNVTGTTLTGTIHIHSPSDVNGASWNNGKFGSGTTTIVE